MLTKYSLQKQLVIIFSIIAIGVLAVLLPIIDNNLTHVIDNEMYDVLTRSQNDFYSYDFSPDYAGSDKQIYHFTYNINEDTLTTAQNISAKKYQILDYVFQNDLYKMVKKNKKKLQEILGLEVNPDIPLVGIVSRLTSQKGLDLINYMMPEIMSENLQMVVLGTGEHQYQSMFNYYDSHFPNKVSARITFDSAFAQQIYAGSDMFLMPSLFEPCGIGQMLAMRYGTLPIVRETGGLKDTVIPYNKYTGEGNGFSFKNYNAHEMLHCIRRAVKVYNDKDRWMELVNNAMNTDSSWKKSATEYIKVYEEIVNQKG